MPAHFAGRRLELPVLDASASWRVFRQCLKSLKREKTTLAGNKKRQSDAGGTKAKRLLFHFLLPSFDFFHVAF